MNSIATSIFPNGSIQFPTGISGTIYFSDTDFDYISGAVVRSYVPTTISNKVNTVKFEAIYGMNPIFDGKKLSVIAWNVSLGATVVYIYDPFTDTWTHSNDNMDNYLPYTYSVSGDPKYVFFATNNYPSRVYVLDTQFATIPATRGMSYTTLSNTSMSIIGGNIDPNNDTAAVWLTPDKGVNWEKKSSAAPWGVRKYFASVTLSDGSIVMMGGSHQAPYTQFNDVWRSTDGGATWVQQTAAAGWSARDAMAAVAMPDDSIVLMGGGDSLHGAADRQVWHSLDQGATWHQHPGVWWSIRITHTCVMIPDGLNGTIVLMGGDQPTGINSGFKDDVWISTDYGESWTQQTAAADWSIRGSHTSVALSDGSIVLMGGFLFDGSQHFYNDVWRSTDLGINWTQQTASASWSPRDAHASVTLSGDVIVLFGGGAGDHNNETWISVNAGANWTKQNPIRESVQITTDDVEIPSGWSIEDMVLATGYGVGSAGEIYIYISDEGLVPSEQMKIYTLPLVAPFTGGSWSDVTPDSITTSGTLATPKRSIYSHSSLATVKTLFGIDDVFFRYWFNDGSSNNLVVVRHTSGTVWNDTHISSPDPFAFFPSDSVFRESGGKLFCGNFYNTITSGETTINVFTSSATLTSSWTNTGFPRTSGFTYVYDIGETTGISGALYLPVTFNDTPSDASLLEGSYTALTSSAVCTITNAVSGDIYNIGGISGEPTTNIIFTMWNNKGYGRGVE